MERDLYVFCGHHKAGTLWFIRMLASVCFEIGLKGAYIPTPKTFNFNLKKHIDENEIDFIWYANADMKYLNQLDNYNGFHVIRDPRDTVVSSYFSHKNSHPTNDWPELIEHRKKLQSVGVDEGLMMELDFSKTLSTNGIDLNMFDALRKWDYSKDNLMEFKFEECIKSPEVMFLDVLRFLGILSVPGEENDKTKISEERACHIVEKNSFKSQAKGREIGQSDEKSHYRKGVAGDWENHFREQHKKYFKELFDDLPVFLGYEEHNNW